MSRVPAMLLVLLLAFGASAADRYLLLFGGPEHEDFLGCLDCGPDEPYSIWNENSDYGSTTHPHSIWNRSGRYGSPDSPHSPWSRAPRSVPIVVDRAGNLLGYFSADRSLPGRVKDELLTWIVDERDQILGDIDNIRREFRSR